MQLNTDGKHLFALVSCTLHANFVRFYSQVTPMNISPWLSLPVQFNQWNRSQNDGAFAAGQQSQPPRLSGSAIRYDSVWKLPGEAKLFISMEQSVGGHLRVLPAHSAVVWATNCTGRKTLCNHHAIVYSGRVTTATGFRETEQRNQHWLEEGRAVVDNPGWA